MSHHKKKHGHPIPSGNQSQAGPPLEPELGQSSGAGGGNPSQELDPQKRLGDYAGMGEHPRQQPTQLNDGQKHSR